MSNGRFIKVLIAAVVCTSLLITPVYAAKQNVNGETLRDPTHPLFFQATRATKQRVVLQGIMSRDHGRQAIVNGQTVEEGDTVGNARVITIEESHIWVLQDGKRIKIALRPTVRK